MPENPEQLRLEAAYRDKEPWLRWGPYLSERQWGTVREDYSDDGKTWEYFSHYQARSRAYRWGEDGLAGISDDKQRLCLALALWNGRDAFLKERLFGLTNNQGNHGEDVKEYYYYLDATPTHSYLKFLYKYPQAAFPYQELVQVNGERSRLEPEYELIDTGIFDEDRYFDVFVEYAKAGPEDILALISIENRGPEDAELHVLPTLWFRNDWAGNGEAAMSVIERKKSAGAFAVIEASHPVLKVWHLYSEGDPRLLFTNNETNEALLFERPNATPYVKDAFHRYVTQEEETAVNPQAKGTKAAAYYQFTLPAAGAATIRLRFSKAAHEAPFADFDEILRARRAEADQYYLSVSPEQFDEDHRRVLRQALAGMIWTKQYYHYDLDRWLSERQANPLLTFRPPDHVPNIDWFHMINDDIISMPDKWEYPWYAAWDLAFQALPLALVDIDFAKGQLDLMLRERYQHPNGQLPAYEWNFSDVNPPVHAWAVFFVYRMDQQQRGQGDLTWLKHAFHKLLINFTWWVNRKDPSGRNVFQGGFLGLDNIGVFDRSRPLPTGGYLEQADGTGWMALYCQNMLEIALELALHEPVYEEMALKFFEHFLYIAAAMDRMGDNDEDLWDGEDGFFYDLLRLPGGESVRLKVRSMVGLLPLCAVTVTPEETLRRFPRLVRRAQLRLNKHPELLQSIHDPRMPGQNNHRMFAILDEQKFRRVLARLFDEHEFLSPYGLRALSRYHADNPYVFSTGKESFKVAYLPAESDSGMFGGNSNWRGPVWFPVNTLIIRSLLHYYAYYGDGFKVEFPTGSGRQVTLFEASKEITQRLLRLFLRDEQGRRPCFGDHAKFQEDLHWRDYLLFYEYFHGDNGRGVGASHQTGWTGLVAFLAQYFNSVDSERLLKEGFRPAPVHR
jgi:hypothetical protein